MSALVLSLGFALPAGAATFTVNSLLDTADASPGNGACDDGAGNCTLRAALQEAAAGAGGDTITFIVSGTIAVATGLPPVTKPSTVIDGTGQTVTLLGNGTSYGIELISSNDTVRALTFSFPNHFAVSAQSGSSGNLLENLVVGGCDVGISLAGSGNIVRGSFVGTDAAGAVANANSWGIGVQGANNVIGGVTAAERNVIAGNTQFGINVMGAQNTTIQGNYIGTDASGSVALGNGYYGVHLFSGAANSTIGGSVAGAGNLISGQSCLGCDGVGIEDPTTQGNLVIGNLVGTNAAGTAALPNTYGVVVTGAGVNTIGGTAPGAGNVISGNTQAGVLLQNTASGVGVFGNLLGVGPDGSTAIPNGTAIWISNSSGNSIGGLGAGEANVLARNGNYGVWVNSGTGNAIRGNSIHHNVALGIRLATGNIANDACDSDTGANQLQNDPVITSAIVSGGSTVISGTLDSVASNSFAIDLFGGVSWNQGATYLGSTTAITDGSCQATWSVLVPGSWNGQPITATATDSAGNTSEFSAPYTATPVELTRFSAE